MSLSVRQLIALKYIPNCGKKSLKILADSAKVLNLDNENLLLDFVNNSIDKKVIKKVSTHVLIEDLHSYLESADEILMQSKSLGIKAISFQDEDYPEQLLSTLDEKGNLDIPVILYYKGNIELAKKPGIAIIGTREPTQEGILASQFFAKQFAEAGYNIISGLALGCDTYAHRGALSVPNGKTTAFLAHGLDSVYPSQNKELLENILEKDGLIISEYPVGTAVQNYNLVARDRLQSGLASSTIVIQTSTDGGTMHAATTTLLAKKPLFCVKYPKLIDKNIISGNTLLVEQGIPISNKNKSIEKEYRRARYITSKMTVTEFEGSLSNL